MQKEIVERLFELQDEKYRDFNASLMPNVDKSRIIGARVPALRRYARELAKEKWIDDFLSSLPHAYFEEDNLHAYLISGIKDFDTCIAELDRFLPYVNNWATCDGIRPVSFSDNANRLILHIERWIGAEHPYTVRFGIEMLMMHFLGEHFDNRYHGIVANIRSDEYYVNMMIAWYFATALAKRWDDTVDIINSQKLPVWVHNRTIQKSCESYRITAEQKQYLRTKRR